MQNVYTFQSVKDFPYQYYFIKKNLPDIPRIVCNQSLGWINFVSKKSSSVEIISLVNKEMPLGYRSRIFTKNNISESFLRDLKSFMR